MSFRRRSASRCLPALLALVLVNSFAVAPVARWCTLVPWSLLFAMRPPLWAVQRYLVGDDPVLAREVQDAVSSVAPRVLAGRISQLLTLPPDTRTRVSVPLLCLQGTQDRIVTRDLVRPHVAAPHAERRELRGPHLLLQANPKEAWAAICEFARAAGLVA